MAEQVFESEREYGNPMSTMEKLKHVFGEELGRENVAESNTLEELKLDSLEFVFLMGAIGKVIAEIPEEKWARIHTVGDIVRILDQDAA